MRLCVFMILVGVPAFALCQSDFDRFDYREFQELARRPEPAANGAAAPPKYAISVTPGYTWADSFHTWSAGAGFTHFGRENGRYTWVLSGKYADKIARSGKQSFTSGITAVYQLEPETKLPDVKLVLAYSSAQSVKQTWIPAIQFSKVVNTVERPKTNNPTQKETVYMLSLDTTINYVSIDPVSGDSTSGFQVDVGSTLGPILGITFDAGYSLPSKVTHDSTWFARAKGSLGKFLGGADGDAAWRVTLRKDNVATVEAILRFISR